MLLSEDNIFTALHAMQKRSSDENSVCPYVKCVHCDKTKERSVQIFIPYAIPFSLVFWEEEWVGGGTPSTLVPKILGQPAPVGAKSPIFNRYSPVAPQP